MSYAAFVDKIDASPTVRLDIDDGVTWGLQASGTEIGAPPVNRAVVSSLLTDGVQIPAAAYGPRTLQLTAKILTASDDDAATQVQKLARELDRPTNLLRWQPDTTNPVFFRLLRGEFADLRFDPVLKQASFTVLAEPFAYGLKESYSSVTVNNDPAAGSNGMYWDVTGVKGDVETPAKLTVPGSLRTKQTLIAVRRRGTPSAAPFVLQAESMTTIGPDTTLQANDPAFSGAGQNWTRTTFADPSFLDRLYVAAFPSSPSVDARGLYRVYCRCRKTIAGDSIQMSLGLGDSSILMYTTDTVTLPSNTAINHIDLGLVQLPVGMDPKQDGPANTDLSVGGIRLDLNIGRSSGTGNCDVDYLLWVPADDRLAIIDWSTSNSDPTNYIIDGVNRTVYAVGASGQVVMNKAKFVGGLPMLTPNQTNRIYLVRQVESGTTEAVTNTTAVTVEYWPRYLYVKPATT